MKKEYSKTLKKLFYDAIKTQVSGVSIWREKSDYVFPGEVIYTLENLNKTKAFIILIPNNKDDSFTVEIAWSKKGQFPELSVRPNDLLIKPEMAEEYSVRLSTLVDGTDKFWSIPKKKLSDPLEEIMANMQKPTDEEALKKLTPLVDDCVKKIVSYGIPFIEEQFKD